MAFVLWTCAVNALDELAGAADGRDDAPIYLAKECLGSCVNPMREQTGPTHRRGWTALSVLEQLFHST